MTKEVPSTHNENMMKFTGIILFAMLLTLGAPAQAQNPPVAEPSTAMREFIMSCTYGVLAGTLVGASMLAFTDQPGDNLSMVARGASLGLYAGIMLGLYVVYMVPDQEQEPDLLGRYGQPRKAPPLLLAPLSNPQGQIDGGMVWGELARF